MSHQNAAPQNCRPKGNLADYVYLPPPSHVKAECRSKLAELLIWLNDAPEPVLSEMHPEILQVHAKMAKSLNTSYRTAAQNSAARSANLKRNTTTTTDLVDCNASAKKSRHLDADCSDNQSTSTSSSSEATTSTSTTTNATSSSGGGGTTTASTGRGLPWMMRTPTFTSTRQLPPITTLKQHPGPLPVCIPVPHHQHPLENAAAASARRIPCIIPLATNDVKPKVF